MKAVELPINVLVLIVIGVIVLLGSIVLLTGIVSQGGNIASLETAKDSTCIKLRIVGCKSLASDVKVSDLDVGGDGKPNTDDDTLLALCNKLGITEERACKEACGCK